MVIIFVERGRGRDEDPKRFSAGGLNDIPRAFGEVTTLMIPTLQDPLVYRAGDSRPLTREEGGGRREVLFGWRDVTRAEANVKWASSR